MMTAINWATTALRVFCIGIYQTYSVNIGINSSLLSDFSSHFFILRYNLVLKKKEMIKNRSIFGMENEEKKKN